MLNLAKSALNLHGVSLIHTFKAKKQGLKKLSGMITPKNYFRHLEN